MELDGARLQTFRLSYQRMLELTVALHRAGVPLVAGTDGWAGLGLHRELELYVQAGIPAPEALRIATSTARAWPAKAPRGRIERGYAADLVLVDGDPLQDITQLRRQPGDPGQGGLCARPVVRGDGLQALCRPRRCRRHARGRSPCRRRPLRCGRTTKNCSR
jgi:hypothetical protein